MGMSGPERSTVSDEQRRRAYLKHVYEAGFQDGLHTYDLVREVAYLADEEALMRYRIGRRIGRRERNR